ncbi:MAG TPA: SGNH/GDSL hydrolase family protein [bacterium]|nr:SGNH/GDSL hydrolase family protein [bacterium]
MKIVKYLPILFLLAPGCRGGGVTPMDLRAGIYPTATLTLTPTLTPTSTPGIAPTQTPAPAATLVFLAIGDSYTGGNGASTITNGFAWLETAVLDIWYPETAQSNFGYGGYGTDDYIGESLSTNDANTSSLNVPRIGVMFGVNDLRQPYAAAWSALDPHKGPAGSYYSNLSDCQAHSYNFKANLETIITTFRAHHSGMICVLDTIPDITNNGDGPSHFAGWDDYEGCLAAYNARIPEIAVDLNYVFVADVYTAMQGHTEYYSTDHIHPNDDGHAVIAALNEAQFSSPPR